jgi:hypothetical protein
LILRSAVNKLLATKNKTPYSYYQIKNRVNLYIERLRLILMILCVTLKNSRSIFECSGGLLVLSSFSLIVSLYELFSSSKMKFHLYESFLKYYRNILTIDPKVTLSYWFNFLYFYWSIDKNHLWSSVCLNRIFCHSEYDWFTRNITNRVGIMTAIKSYFIRCFLGSISLALC